MNDDPIYIGQQLLNRGFRQWFLYLFRVVNRTEWKEQDIHKEMFAVLQSVIDGKCSRLNFNICPRSGKCFGKGTLIRMYDGSVKKVEDIVVGDVVMGDDETPRHVLSLGRGREEMFRITHEDGSSFVCNKSHLLVLRNTTNQRNWEWGKVKKQYRGLENIISVGDYINTTKNFKKRNKAIKAKCDYCEKNLFLDPYLLGVWLGDGDTNSARITNMDTEIIDYIHSWALQHNNKITVFHQKNTKCNIYAVSASTKKDIPFRILLKQVGVLGHKHIPQQYLTASRQQRLELLAGIIDTDGSCSGNNAIEIISVRKELADNYIELARSLGFRAKQSIKVIGGKNYYRCYISGDLSVIPIKVKRKIFVKAPLSKISPLYQSFKVEHLGIDNYYGFVIDGNHKFLLADYTVVHNTTMAVWLVVYALTLNPKSQIIYTSFNQDLLSQIAQQVAAIMQHPVYQAMYPRQITETAEETDPVDDFWKDYLIETTGKIKFSNRKIVTPQGGVVLFNSIGSAITGFGIGVRGASGFSGFLVMDDSDKPTDVRSETIRKKTHTYYVETLLTRLNNADAPILNIQQRLHIDDMSGFLAREYSFKTFKAPLLDKDGNCNLSNQYTPERIQELQVNNYVFQAQYQQEPTILGGGVIRHDYWRFYKDIEDTRYRKIFITADTATKTKEWNDFTAIGCWGLTIGNKLRLLDLIHGKFEITELQNTLLAFWEKWKMGIGNCHCSEIIIEDKASGMQAIQNLRRVGGLPIRAYTPEKDKLQRVEDVLPQIAAGNVELPHCDSDPISRVLIAEADSFTADFSHLHDDLVDMSVMAIDKAFFHRGMF